MSSIKFNFFITFLFLYQALPVMAESGFPVAHNSYGAPGIIDMPIALAAPDAELRFGYSHFTAENRSLINFQFHPRLNFGFRYARVRDYFEDDQDLYDRSLTAQFLIQKEHEFAPAISIGLNDILGTGISSSEYIVATKTLSDFFRVSFGIGFGRFAGNSDFSNPFTFLNKSFGARDQTIGDGGVVQSGRIFRGDGAYFGGVEWLVRDDITLIGEYSPDVYPTSDKAFKQASPLNFGIRYIGKQSYEISAYYLYGSQIGLSATAFLNPKQPAYGPGLDPAPPAVSPAEGAATLSLDWGGGTDDGSLSKSFREALKKQGITLTRFDIAGDKAEVEVLRSNYSRPAQVIGRTARVMTRSMPREIKTFSITLTSTGIKGSKVVLKRDMLEENENHFDGSWRSYIAADFQEPTLPPSVPILKEAFDRGVSFTPYVKSSYFDPDDPYRGDIGVQLRATYEFAEGSYIQGILRQRIAGTLAESTRKSDSVLPKVRSESNRYDKYGDLLITELTYSHRYQPTSNIFTRTTLGYIEPAFAGISTEVLWKPLEKRYGVGLEMNYVRQREFDQRFGLRDYKVGTGHLSLYYDIGSGYHGQLDLGRYLAGDWGGTFSLAREFENGWRIGAFATFTNVSFRDFGEGSFDKGFHISIPTNLATGEPTSNIYSTTLRPIMRDGGARLNVSGRLYGAVRELQKPELADSWGRFWK